MPKIDKAEVAETLGVSSWTVGKFVREHRIPHYRVGRRVIFDLDEVNEWLAARRVAEEGECSRGRRARPMTDGAR